MKIIPILLLALVALLGPRCASAQNYDVTFLVDLSQVGTIASTVSVAGSFQAAAGFPSDWTPGSTVMNDDDGDEIYALTVQLPAGTYEYKFINGTAWGLDEPVPGACQVNGNRGLTVNAALLIPVVCFGECAACVDPVTLTTIDDFETPLANGAASNGGLVGYFTFQGGGSAATIERQATPPAPLLPAVGAPNQVLSITLLATDFAGFIHNFENETVDLWLSQDWSKREGISFWFHGNGSGSSLFFDVLDNRNPGSMVDDAERFRFSFSDDTAGWRFLQLPFASFSRVEIANGAPNDGFTLTSVWGYALGTQSTPGQQTFHLDEVALYGLAVLAPVQVFFANSVTSVIEDNSAEVTVLLDRALTEADPVEVTIAYATAGGNARPGEHYQPASGVLTFTRGGPTMLGFQVPTFGNSKANDPRRVGLTLGEVVGGEPGALTLSSLLIQDDDLFDPDLLDDFEYGAFQLDAGPGVALQAPRIISDDLDARPGQDAFEGVLQVDLGLSAVKALGGADVRFRDGFEPRFTFERVFPLAQNWQGRSAVDFWFRGAGSGESLSFRLFDNREPDPGPDGWMLSWSDEFDGSAGAAPDPSHWNLAVDNISPTGAFGWGNSELQFYTDALAEAATDGQGNLVISASEADEDRACFYGRCQYESARLDTRHKVELAYGRIEVRMLLPDGPAGLWPSLRAVAVEGDRIGQPQAGQIDLLEYVSRIPAEIFGSLQGPGYSGGASFGNTYDFGMPAAQQAHVIAIEWEPGVVRWSVDGVLFHEATPDDISPNQWVFDKPFYLTLGLAMGGNFGGPIDNAMAFPQQLVVDYVRVFQAADSAERFEAPFTDSSAEWQQVSIPLDAFQRSLLQPAGAPDDGLGLGEVWGYGIDAGKLTGVTLLLDQVRIVD